MATTFPLKSRSSFSYCDKCGRPVVHRRDSSHSCDSSAVSSRRSSAASVLAAFFFGDKVGTPPHDTHTHTHTMMAMVVYFS